MLPSYSPEERSGSVVISETRLERLLRSGRAMPRFLQGIYPFIGRGLFEAEPYDVVAVVIPDEHIGATMSDLSSRRARLLGTDKVGDDRTVINAEVPQTELVRYAVDLRSATHGAGSFTRSFGHYEPMPEDVARTVATRER